MTEALRAPASAGQRAPSADQFPLHSAGWHLFCHARELAPGPVSRELFGRSLVAWRAGNGAMTIMDARCSHLGADLSRGTLDGNCLRCPFHHWEYGTDGRCQRIPAQAEVPRFARQKTWPAAVMGPFLFVFNGSESLYPLPFFPNKHPADFLPAAPIIATLDCPWYLVGSNGFDQQHFAAAHDRKMISEPLVETPDPYCRRASATFQIAGSAWRDLATKAVAGPEVTLTCTDWSGALIFVTARFRRSTSYGMVSVRALEARKTLVQVIIWVPRSRTRVSRLLLDPLHAWLRRYFIRKFLEPDAANLHGCAYQPHRLIDADAQLADYFHWLADASRGDISIPQIFHHKEMA